MAKVFEAVKSFFRTGSAGESKPLPEPIYVNYAEGAGGSGGDGWVTGGSGGSSGYIYFGGC